METAYDWITVLIFAGIATRFLSQSMKPGPTEDRLWHYLIPAAGCALANWLGNEGWDLAAIAVILLTLACIHRLLGPFGHSRPRH